MESLGSIFAGVITLMKAKFGLQMEQMTGDLAIKFVATTLQGMALLPHEKAAQEYYSKQLVDLYAALGPLTIIRQPSSAQQADIVFYTDKVKEAQRELQKI